MKAVTIPVIATVKEVVNKNIYLSKKYRLACTVMIWAITCWGSIPDSAVLVSQAFKNLENYNYRKLFTRLFTDFLLMAAKFFIRRAGILFVMTITC